VRGRDGPTPASATAQQAGIAALVALGLALRLWHLEHGLPDFTEEAIPFRKALEMWGWDTGRTDWNPHVFHYPSLTFYLQLWLQKLHFAIGRVTGAFASRGDYFVLYHLDPTPMVVVGRLLGIASDLVTIVCAALIGERVRRGTGLLAATLVAFSPTLLLASRSIFADTVMTALAMAALERMLAFRASGGPGKLVAASVLTGLAAGAKYPALLMTLPLFWVACERRAEAGGAPAGPGAVRALGGFGLEAVAGALAVFLATSPFIVLDWRTFSHDFEFLSHLTSQGHLGNLQAPGFAFHLRNLAADQGWPALALLALSAAFAAMRARAEGAWILLWTVLLLFGVPISLAHIEAERYLIPVIPPVALLASMAAWELGGGASERWRSSLSVALIALLAIPVVAAGTRAAATGVETTQGEARRWCEQNLGGRLLLQEHYGAVLATPNQISDIRESAPFHEARAEIQKRLLGHRTFHAVTLPLVISGTASNRVQSAEGRWLDLEIFPHPVDLNRLFYDPRLLEGVDLMLTSSQVRGRFEADPPRFEIERNLYRVLDEVGEVAAEFRPHGLVEGPRIRIYRLGPRAQETIERRLGPLDPLWWAEVVPPSYRARAEAILLPEARRNAATRYPDGRPAAWVVSLAPLFADKVDRFAFEMALYLAELDRCRPSESFAAASLTMNPGDLSACLLYVTCAGELGEWARARAASERTLEALGGGTGPELSVLRLDHASTLSHTGEPDSARRELEAVLQAVEPGSAVAQQARKMLEDLRGGH